MDRPARLTRLIVVGALVVVAAGVVAWVPIPYYGVGPGPAREVAPQILLDGQQRYDPTGRLIWTTVRYWRLTPLAALAAWIDPNDAIVGQDVLYPPSTTREEADQRSISQMDQSKIDATSVVLSRLDNYPHRHGNGALVEATVPGCPADGQLFPGDVITQIDLQPVATRAQASRLIDAVPKGKTLAFTVDVDGTVEHVSFQRAPCGENGEALVGVSLLDAFPFDVTISSGDVGGPSAGMMWALGLYELLTPGDLTAGRTIAGTGTIDLAGNVGPIGEIRDKVVAAQDAGASVFLAPADNMNDLAGVDTGSMQVISVATFPDALRALREGSTNP
jgi:PDZ domain-containing protein